MIRVRHVTLAAVALSVALGARAAPFDAEQRRNPRVRAAFEAREPALATLFRTAGAPFPPKGILLRGFKREAALELWADRGDGRHVLVQTYPICATSVSSGRSGARGTARCPRASTG